MLPIPIVALFYLKPGRVEVQKIDFPTYRNPAGKTIDHGVILRS